MVKTTLVAAGIVAAFIAASANGQSVTRVDLDGDGAAAAFRDARTGLLWTNGNTFAAKSFAAASVDVGNAVLEGVTSWRLPTQAEFLSLYESQLLGAGTPNGTSFPRPPFTLNANFYWTTDVFESTGTTVRYIAFDPNHSPSGQAANFFSTTTVGVWAVSNVPEPRSVLLAGFGLLAIALARARRGA